jgi:hypothetical protein
MVERTITKVGNGFRPLLIESFDSLNDFYDTAAANAGAYVRNEMRDNDTARKVRDGNLNGMPEALEIAEQAVQSSVELRNAASFTNSYDVAGNSVDVGRFVSGDPECMTFNPMRITKTVTRVVTLVSMADSNGGGDWATRGAMATALGMALHRMGMATEMWADNYGSSSSGNQYQRILVKSTADTLDPARLLFAFGDYDMLTTLAFGCFDGYERMGAAYAPFDAGFGGQGSRGSSRDRTEQLESLYPEGTIFITGQLDSPGPVGMRNAITAELRKLGLLD